MKRRTCYYCGKEYAVVKDDSLVVDLGTSPWKSDVCKRCICYLRRYHKWTVTDAGLRLCGACFLPRHSLALLVKMVAARRKRDLGP